MTWARSGRQERRKKTRTRRTTQKAALPVRIEHERDAHACLIKAVEERYGRKHAREKSTRSDKHGLYLFYRQVRREGSTRKIIHSHMSTNASPTQRISMCHFLYLTTRRFHYSLGQGFPLSLFEQIVVVNTDCSNRFPSSYFLQAERRRRRTSSTMCVGSFRPFRLLIFCPFCLISDENNCFLSRRYNIMMDSFLFETIRQGVIFRVAKKRETTHRNEEIITLATLDFDKTSLYR